MNPQQQYPRTGPTPGQAPPYPPPMGAPPEDAPPPPQYPPVYSANGGYHSIPAQIRPQPPGKRPGNMGQIVAAIAGVLLLGFVIGGEIVRKLGERSSGHQSVVVGPVRPLEPGISFHEVDLPGGDGTRTLWIYLPTAISGAKAPCVFMAPVRDTCYQGMSLGDADRADQLAYARAGYAVVAYSLDGAPSAGLSPGAQVAAIEAFQDAHAGVDNAKAAMAYAVSNLPQIDTAKLYTAGRGFAGSTALLAAENDARIDGCIAFAPRSNVRADLSDRELDMISQRVDGFGELLTDCSPLTKARLLHCPVFVFHADDDQDVPTDEVEALVAGLRDTNTPVTYCHADEGGGDKQGAGIGISQSLSWLQSGMPNTPDLAVSTPGSTSISIPIDSAESPQSQ